MTIGHLIHAFLAGDSDARGWASDPETFNEIDADCHPMSQRFATFLHDHGKDDARLVELSLRSDLDPGFVGPYHAVCEVDGLWIDWTARQFYNVEGIRLTYDEIPCPLIWVAGQPYPLPDIDADGMWTEGEQDGDGNTYTRM